MGDIPLQALLSGYEVVDDIRETDIGASDEAKEANKEESDIFDKSESVNMRMWYSGWLIVLWCSLTRSEDKTFTSLFFSRTHIEHQYKWANELTWYICDLEWLYLSLLAPLRPAWNSIQIPPKRRILGQEETWEQEKLPKIWKGPAWGWQQPRQRLASPWDIWEIDILFNVYTEFLLVLNSLW